jgi:hypothetical protein
MTVDVCSGVIQRYGQEREGCRLLAKKPTDAQHPGPLAQASGRQQIPATPFLKGVAVDRADPACYGFAVKSLIHGHSVLPDDRPVSQTASKRSTETIFGD